MLSLLDKIYSFSCLFIYLFVSIHTFRVEGDCTALLGGGKAEIIAPIVVVSALADCRRWERFFYLLTFSIDNLL